MPRVSLAFFTFAALCGLTGMGWGIWMGIAENHQTFSAHAHLNLLGWVSCSLMGAFYALAKERVSEKLAWTNLALSSSGVVLMIPALAARLLGIDAPWVMPVLICGSLTVFSGMATFVASVVTTGVRARRLVVAQTV